MSPNRSVKGQVFLADNEYLRRIAEAAAVEAEELVVEIGMGRGELTQHLVRRARAVVSVELEERFVNDADEIFRSRDNLTVVHANVLDVDWGELIPAGQKAVVVGNIPYYITGPIIRTLEEEKERISRWTLLVQKEVAERLCALPGARSYSALTVKIQTWGDPYLAFVVPAGAFEPVPRVDSALVTYTFKPRPAVAPAQAAAFTNVVDFIFGGRRKKLANRLATLLGGSLSRDGVVVFLRDNGFDADARPQDVSPPEFVRLFELLTPYLPSV